MLAAIGGSPPSVDGFYSTFVGSAAEAQEPAQRSSYGSPRLMQTYFVAFNSSSSRLLGGAVMSFWLVECTKHGVLSSGWDYFK